VTFGVWGHRRRTLSDASCVRPVQCA
jgi:hypothetical protein